MQARFRVGSRRPLYKDLCFENVGLSLGIKDVLRSCSGYHLLSKNLPDLKVACTHGDMLDREDRDIEPSQLICDDMIMMYMLPDTPPCLNL